MVLHCVAALGQYSPQLAAENGRRTSREPNNAFILFVAS